MKRPKAVQKSDSSIGQPVRNVDGSMVERKVSTIKELVKEKCQLQIGQRASTVMGTIYSSGDCSSTVLGGMQQLILPLTDRKGLLFDHSLLVARFASGHLFSDGAQHSSYKHSLPHRPSAAVNSTSKCRGVVVK